MRRLEAIPGGSKVAGTGIQDEDDASVTAGAGGAVGFTTVDSIRQVLVSFLPARFDLRAIHQQVRRRVFVANFHTKIV